MKLGVRAMVGRYGLIGSCRLVIDLLYTRIFYPNCRLVRSSARIRGDTKITLGDGMTIGIDFRLDCFGRGQVAFGRNIEINDNVHIAAVESIEIGENTLIGSKVLITDHNHGAFDTDTDLNAPSAPPAQRPLSSRQVVIGRNVWIGESVCILPGVVIGSGAVIGAGSVVTRSLPPNTLSAGNPARVIRKYNDQTGRWDKVDHA